MILLQGLDIGNLQLEIATCENMGLSKNSVALNPLDCHRVP